ncbi:hypothetical protein M0812_07892 [Anaeramoeba flamelloides]|uniref:Uncharacterized protein n=1 Tax=Anaeramoeba flamelloides TaxID=1746091 RepID=A0AAV8A2C3_9EUKA|nr:hypothetical protein M0812_07892 [Anaeramoeba flamelloides]
MNSVLVVLLTSILIQKMRFFLCGRRLVSIRFMIRPLDNSYGTKIAAIPQFQHAILFLETLNKKHSKFVELQRNKEDDSTSILTVESIKNIYPEQGFLVSPPIYTNRMIKCDQYLAFMRRWDKSQGQYSTHGHSCQDFAFQSIYQASGRANRIEIYHSCTRLKFGCDQIQCSDPMLAIKSRIYLPRVPEFRSIRSFLLSAFQMVMSVCIYLSFAFVSLRALKHFFNLTPQETEQMQIEDLQQQFWTLFCLSVALVYLAIPSLDFLFELSLWASKFVLYSFALLKRVSLLLHQFSNLFVMYCRAIIRLLISRSRFIQARRRLIEKSHSIWGQARVLYNQTLHDLDTYELIPRRQIKYLKNFVLPKPKKDATQPKSKSKSKPPFIAFKKIQSVIETSLLPLRQNFEQAESMLIYISNWIVFFVFSLLLFCKPSHEILLSILPFDKNCFIEKIHHIVQNSDLQRLTLIKTIIFSLFTLNGNATAQNQVPTSALENGESHISNYLYNDKCLVSNNHLSIIWGIFVFCFIFKKFIAKIFSIIVFVVLLLLFGVLWIVFSITFFCLHLLSIASYVIYKIVLFVNKIYSPRSHSIPYFFKQFVIMSFVSLLIFVQWSSVDVNDLSFTDFLQSSLVLAFVIISWAAALFLNLLYISGIRMIGINYFTKSKILLVICPFITMFLLKKYSIAEFKKML